MIRLFKKGGKLMRWQFCHYNKIFPWPKQINMAPQGHGARHGWPRSNRLPSGLGLGIRIWPIKAKAANVADQGAGG